METNEQLKIIEETFLKNKEIIDKIVEITLVHYHADDRPTAGLLLTILVTNELGI
jgi:hypothetical protein